MQISFDLLKYIIIKLQNDMSIKKRIVTVSWFNKVRKTLTHRDKNIETD